MTGGFEQIIFLNVRFWFRCGCQMGAWGIMSCGEGELTFEYWMAATDESGLIPLF